MCQLACMSYPLSSLVFLYCCCIIWAEAARIPTAVRFMWWVELLKDAPHVCLLGMIGIGFMGRSCSLPSSSYYSLCFLHQADEILYTGKIYFYTHSFSRCFYKLRILKHMRFIEKCREVGLSIFKTVLYYYFLLYFDRIDFRKGFWDVFLLMDLNAFLFLCVCVCFSDKIECFLYYITTVKQFNYIIFACVDVILFLLYFERNYFRKDILVSFLLFVMVYVYIYSFRSFYQKLLKMIEFWYIWMLLFLYDGYEWFL